MDDLISVIVPIYKVEPYLKQCIESILAQTYSDLEIILVVKEAGDNCLKICRSYEEKDTRVKVLIQQDSGLYAARRLGLQAATGTYLGFVDSDDWIEPEMYEQLHRLMVENDVAVVEVGFFAADYEVQYLSLFDEGCYKEEKFRKEIAPKFLCMDNFYPFSLAPAVWNKLYRLDSFAKYQRPNVPTQVIFDDAVCTFPCILETESLYVSHTCYYHYRYRIDSGVHSIFEDKLAVALAMNSHMLLCERIKGSGLKPISKNLQIFLLFNLLHKAPAVFDDPQDEYLLRPFGTIRRTDRIALYGAGTFGEHVKAYLDRAEDSPVVCWLDRNYEQKQSGVQAPQAILDYEYDWVVIAIMNGKTVQAVKKDLVSIGVPAKKICWILPEYLEQPQTLLQMATLDGKRIMEG